MKAVMILFLRRNRHSLPIQHYAINQFNIEYERRNGQKQH